MTCYQWGVVAVSLTDSQKLIVVAFCQAVNTPKIRPFWAYIYHEKLVQRLIGNV